MKRLVAYVSHPVGSSNGNDMIHRQNNIANAAGWIRYLVLHTHWAILCPWYPYVVALDEQHLPRGMVDNTAVLERCDLLIQCGGQVSTNMVVEEREAGRHRVPVVNLTDLGFQPPWGASINKLLSERAELAIRATPRRKWMPPLTLEQIRTLEAGCHTTNEKAREILGEILHSALLSST